MSFQSTDYRPTDDMGAQAALAQLPDVTDLIAFFNGLATAINGTNGAWPAVKRGIGLPGMVLSSSNVRAVGQT